MSAVVPASSMVVGVDIAFRMSSSIDSSGKSPHHASAEALDGNHCAMASSGMRKPVGSIMAWVESCCSPAENELMVRGEMKIALPSANKCMFCTLDMESACTKERECVKSNRDDSSMSETMGDCQVAMQAITEFDIAVFIAPSRGNLIAADQDDEFRVSRGQTTICRPGDGARPRNTVESGEMVLMPTVVGRSGKVSLTTKEGDHATTEPGYNDQKQSPFGSGVHHNPVMVSKIPADEVCGWGVIFTPTIFMQWCTPDGEGCTQEIYVDHFEVTKRAVEWEGRFSTDSYQTMCESPEMSGAEGLKRVPAYHFVGMPLGQDKFSVDNMYPNFHGVHETVKRAAAGSRERGTFPVERSCLEPLVDHLLSCFVDVGVPYRAESYMVDTAKLDGNRVHDT